MPAQFTLPPDTRAVGTGNPPVDIDGLVDAVTAMGGALNVLNTAWAGGADPLGGTDATLAINTALGAASPGQVVTGQGVFKTTGPLLIPSGVELRGTLPATQSGNSISSDWGLVLKPAPNWSAGAQPVSGVITLNGVNRASVRDVFIDGSTSPANVDGIAGYGAVNAASIIRCGIYHVTGNGISAVPDLSSNSPDGWHLDTVIVQQAGLNGVTGRYPDATLANVHCQSCGGDGFSLTGGSNIRCLGCRADLNANGFTFDNFPSSGYNDSVILIGCGTQRNTKNGLNLINSSAPGTDKRVPVIVSGCTFDGDGVNGGAGGGGFAGIAVAGNNKVTISSTNVMVMTVDVAGGCPQYGLATAAAGTGPGVPTVVEMTSGLLNYATAAVNNAAPAAQLLTGQNVLAAAGYNPAAVAPLNPSLLLVDQPAGAVAATLPRGSASATSSALTSGTLYVRLIPGVLGTTTAAATLYTGAGVKSGGTHGWYALLDSTRKVVAVTADQTDAATVWGTASTPYLLNWGAAYAFAYTGVFYLGIMVAAATTMPTFFTGVALDTNLAGVAPVVCGSSSTAQTTPPALGTTMAALTAINSMNLYGVLT